MTDRLYFAEGHHKDYAAIIEREASVTGVTPNGDREYYGYDEVVKAIQSVERYAGDAEAVSYETGKGMSETTYSPSHATEADATDDTSQPSTVPSNGRAELQKAMIDAGIDVSDVSITRDDTDRVFRIETGPDIDKSEGSPWREWADPIFDNRSDGPGSTTWNDEGGYPEHYDLPYDSLEDVVG